MIFTSLTFGIFLIVVFAVYWSLRRQAWRNGVLVVASYVFYGWWDWRFCSLMLASSLVDYFIALALGRTRSAGLRRALLVLSVLANLGLLGFFKYFNFFAENAQALAQTLGIELSWTTLNITLPVGISFYTFQTLSYTIDVYRGHMPPSRRFVAYLAYVSFFPQLVAGPIERATRLLPQFLETRRFDATNARDGLRQMLWGCFKKLVIADNLALFVDPVFNNVPDASGPMLLLATFAFAWQIYCDFSGYSDIAIGCAKLFDFQLMRNFAYPYFSQGVAEFWRRWHISLATWFRDYLYIPLGGSRVPPLRRGINVLVTFMISGFWHGAAWNFVIWGAINGVATLPAVLNSACARRDSSDTPGGESNVPSVATLARMIATFGLICLAWVFFRATTFEDATSAIGRIALGLFDSDGWRDVGDAFSDERSAMRAFIYVAILILIEWIMRRHLHPLDVVALARPWRWVIYTVVLWSILYDGTGGVQAFIYFQF